MSITLPLDQMTTAEKLQAMEDLWADLTRNEREFESPARHEGVLKEREERLRTGPETPIDREVARKHTSKGLRLLPVAFETVSLCYLLLAGSRNPAGKSSPGLPSRSWMDQTPTRRLAAD